MGPVKIYFRRMGRQHDFRSDHAALFGVIADFSIVAAVKTLPGSVAVSYTHLDVYKRQGLYGGFHHFVKLSYFCFKLLLLVLVLLGQHIEVILGYASVPVQAVLSLHLLLCLSVLLLFCPLSLLLHL